MADTIRGVCPQCGKKLEIPAELEEFSCLYCGARMRTEALQAKPVQAEAVEALLAQLPGCITRYPDLHLRIGKKDFFPTFAQYEQDNTPLLLQLDACCAGYPGGAEALAGHAAAVMLDGLAAHMEKDPRWGRRTPFIVVGALLAAALTPLIAVANAMHNLPLFVTVLVATLVVLSIYRSPSVALMPDVTPRPVRSKADAFNSLMAALGGVIVLVAIALLVPAEENPDYIPVYLVISFMLLVTTIIFMVLFREPKEVAALHRESAELGIPEDEIEASDEGGKERETDPVKRRSLVCVLVCVFFYFMSNNAVTSGISRYADVVWGMAGGSYAQVQTVATLAAIVAYMPMAELSCKIGRKVTTYIGIALMVVSPLLISGATGFSAIIYVWVALFGIGMATVSLTVYPMIMELASANTTGRYTGFYYTASMSAQVVTPILSGAVMQFVGYQYLYVYVAICAAISAVPLLFVKNADSLTMDEVRERQAAAEGEKR